MQGWKEQRLCLMQRLKRWWCFPLSLEISGRGCPRILSRHHLFNGVANFDAFEESACKSGEALSSFAEGRICPRSQFPSSRSFARNRENYLSRTCRIKLYSISFFARPRKNNTFSKLLRSTVLAEKFLTRHNVVKTCWKLFVPLRRVCSIKTERSLVRSTSENPVDDDSRQEKFRSSSLFELLVGKDDSLLSFRKDLDGARKRRFALSGEHRPGYHFLRKITIPCEPGREDLSPRGCQKRLLLLASDDERRQETFRGSSRFPSQRRCLRRRLITGETWRDEGVTAKNLSRMLIPASIPSLRFERTKCSEENNPTPFLGLKRASLSLLLLLSSSTSSY